ncbi:MULTISPECIES: ATP-binding protein [unclassified Nonomuraea]|uniref:ATP-binding protein n=1 Tax=unclassified Nonomuraea TaxID=2593643 RepID=UPI0033F6473F
MVYEGEVVDDQPERTRLLPSAVVDRVMVIRPSPGAQKTALVLATHGAIVLTGWHSYLVRMLGGLTDGVIREQIRAARALGDDEKLAFWLDKRREAKRDRRDRLKEMPLLVLRVGAFTGMSVAGVLMLLVIVATVVWMTGAGDWADLWVWLGGVIRWLIGAVSVAWSVFAVTWPVWLIVAGHRAGRRSGATPAWVDRAATRSAGGRMSEPVLVTPSIVVTALRDIGYAPLRRAIKEMGDAGAAMLGPISIAGCGVEVDVLLPSGTSTDEVQKRRRKLAENMGRHEHEVFISITKKARTVRLWIADPGALDEPIGPSPLVSGDEVKADYVKGLAPWGQNLRGEPTGISLHQRMLLITGLSNQGKTASLRALALWLAFDPRVRFWIADLKGDNDWSMFDGLAEVLIEGPTDEHVARATRMVEGAVAEMERRLQAPVGAKFDPLIVIVDEAQVAFMCPEKDEDNNPYGGTKATSRYFNATRKIHNQGRAVDVVLWQGTQNPTDQNLPVLVREGAHIRAALVLSTESQAKMALGEKAVEAGAAPHLLRQDLDKGTVVTNGAGTKLPAGQSSVTIRTHFIGKQEAAEVADRAKALRNGTATLDGASIEEPQVDPLLDIAAVLGDEARVLTQEVLQRLAARNPGRYRGWTPGDLKEVLEEAGADSYKSDGRMVVGRERVLRALENREESASEDGAG